MKEFFRKLFGIKSEEDDVEDEYKYKIKILDVKKVTLDEDLDTEVDVVECTVNGTKEKYMYFWDTDCVLNFDSLVAPKDEDFVCELQWAISDFNGQLQATEEQKRCQEIGKKIKDQILGITTIELPASTTNTVIEKPVAQQEAALPKSASSVMDRFVEKTIKEIEATRQEAETSKSEETSEVAVAKKKGGRPKKVLN
jgi:hypothetical protein